MPAAGGLAAGSGGSQLALRMMMGKKHRCAGVLVTVGVTPGETVWVTVAVRVAVAVAVAVDVGLTACAVHS